MDFFEFLIRSVFGNRGLVKALVVGSVLYAIGYAAGLLVRQNVGEGSGIVVAILLPLAIVVWVLINPVASRFRMWVFQGLYGAVSVGIVVAMVGLVVTLIQVKLHLGQWVRPALPYAAGLLLAVLLRRGSMLLLDRGHRALGERSALNPEG